MNGVVLTDPEAIARVTRKTGQCIAATSVTLNDSNHGSTLTGDGSIVALRPARRADVQ